jgi:hypothetical protein
MPESSGSSIGGSFMLSAFNLIIILVVGAVALFALGYYAYRRHVMANEKQVFENVDYTDESVGAVIIEVA